MQPCDQFPKLIVMTGQCLTDNGSAHAPRRCDVTRLSVAYVQSSVSLATDTPGTRNNGSTLQ